MDAQKALELVKELGVARLGGFDGCLCTCFEIQGVHVDVSCRKSSDSRAGLYGTLIRVYSNHLDCDREGLAKIAREVAECLKEDSPNVFVRYADYRHDKENICVYCDEPRNDPAGYLCDKHFTKHGPYGMDLIETYDMRKYEFKIIGYDKPLPSPPSADQPPTAK